LNAELIGGLLAPVVLAAIVAFLRYVPRSTQLRLLTRVGWALVANLAFAALSVFAYLAWYKLVLGLDGLLTWESFKLFAGSTYDAQKTAHILLTICVLFPKSGPRFVGQMMLLGLSLLPLSALILALPAVMPQESVITDAVSSRRSRFRRLVDRLSAVFSGFIVLACLLAFSTELVSHLPLPKSSNFGNVAETLVGKSVADRLPEAMVKQWPYVLLTMYIFDILILAIIGRVPLQYNVRNLLVRWRITFLTALAFTVVVALLTVMLAFVNGMNELTENSGIPGNVFILSDSANDEVFSSLGYGDINKLDSWIADTDPNGAPLAKPIVVKREVLPGGKDPVALVSKETYFVISQIIKQTDKLGDTKRFIQVRGIEDPLIAASVHKIKLSPDSRWWSEAGSKDGVIEAVVGEGIAATMGVDVGKSMLGPNDEFDLGDRKFRVVGVMLAEGSTFGSEIWAKRTRVGPIFGKTDLSTVVVRVEDDTLASSRMLAKHLGVNFKSPKLKATAEPDYYSELNKTNKQFLSAILAIAAIMAIGGIFGVMNTMFATIAQRARDIGVLRILGFKRWQILVSFMLETLLLAVLGGLLGLAIGSLCHGLTATSVLSSGQGGGKSVVLRMVVDTDIVICGLMFSIIMGRLGGLVPAISSMRMGILESLR